MREGNISEWRHLSGWKNNTLKCDGYEIQNFSRNENTVGFFILDTFSKFKEIQAHSTSYQRRNFGTPCTLRNREEEGT